MTAILTLNAGSSSIKFGLYLREAEPQQIAVGQVDGLGPQARLILEARGDRSEADLGAADHSGGIAAILDAIGPVLEERRVTGVGHRVVHGGTEFDAPAVLTGEVRAALHRLAPLAPLHQPHNLAAVEAAVDAFPEALQVGCFDTAFHRGHPFVNDAFGLPRRLYDAGVRRYGFHGLSYDYIAGRLAADYPALHAGRVVVAHLGNGASMCGLREGRSVASTMGFSALDGLPMGTRCGQVDPGVLLYLLDEGMTPAELTAMLYKESGLKGLSGLSHDMRVLLASQAPEAAEAIDYYVFRIRRELGAMAAALGGIDGVVFCGGIGENAAPIRARVLEGMEWMGLVLDAEANAAGGPVISAGPATALVIPTDEERVIARATHVELDRAAA
jgi:acetate kinase